MLAANPEAVIESLKSARRLHSISFGLAVLALGLLVSPQSDLTVPFLSFNVPIAKFALLAMIVSASLLTLVKSFMEDGLNGARYMSKREDAMTVGTLPWALSRYTGEGMDKQIQSVATRLVMAYHPIVYIYLIKRADILVLFGLGRHPVCLVRPG